MPSIVALSTGRCFEAAGAEADTSRGKVMVAAIQLIGGVGLLTLAMRRLTTFSLWLLSITTSTSASTLIVNLTTATIDGYSVTLAGVVSGPPKSEQVVGGFIHNAFFRRTVRNDDFGAGSGGFRDLYRIQQQSCGLPVSGKCPTQQPNQP
jgi:hypothetical protein